MIKPMPLSFIEDINKISREKILSSLYREKLLFKLAMSGAEAPIVGPEFPFIPNLISKFDESLAQFDEERVESQRLRNAIETEEQARKRKENAFGNLFRNKYTPVPDGNFAMGVRSINEIQEKKRKSVKIRRRSITSNSTQQLSFKLPKLFDVESLDLVSETEFGSEYSLDLETDGLASPSDKYLKNPEVPVLSPLITEEKLATLNESLEELIQVDENKLNEKDEIGNEDNKNNMDNLITLSTESKQEKYELKKENKNEDEKEDNIRGKKEDIKELKNEEIMETSRESTLEIPITQLKNQLHQMMVEDDNKILLQIENVLNNSNYTKMDKNLLKSNLVKQATRLKKKSLSLNIKNLKD
ncbi:hypothetical protein K502DRAFT_188539 [Neoconidiobolus thromboides FSU 785]|nr:hypothetical protein K502DRAFT_188539 [Neoconidiobolus thromboides FSU 785]